MLTKIIKSAKMNLTVQIENPWQERKFHKVMKDAGISVPKRDIFAFIHVNERMIPIYPIYYRINEYNDRPVIFWDVKKEYVKDTNIIKLKNYLSLVSLLN